MDAGHRLGAWDPVWPVGTPCCPRPDPWYFKNLQIYCLPSKIRKPSNKFQISDSLEISDLVTWCQGVAPPGGFVCPHISAPCYLPGSAGFLSSLGMRSEEDTEHFKWGLWRRERACDAWEDWEEAGGGCGASTVLKVKWAERISEEMGRRWRRWEES